jgi:hypothetical protein
MYSIDGVTWSTRPEELEAIIQRHLMQQAGVSADLKGEEKVPAPKVKPKKFNRVHDDSELDEVIEEDSDDEKLEDLDDDLIDDSDDIDIKPLSVKKIVQSKSVKPEVKKAAVKSLAKVKEAVKAKAKPAAKPSAKPKKEVAKKVAKKPAAKPASKPAKAKKKK